MSAEFMKPVRKAVYNVMRDWTDLQPGRGSATKLDRVRRDLNNVEAFVDSALASSGGGNTTLEERMELHEMYTVLQFMRRGRRAVFPANSGGSIHAVSGGLPSLGKR